jgi:hypothetical protein
VIKYHNQQSAASDGKVFSSKRERNRYEELLMLWKAGAITEPRLQPRYELIPAQEGERKVEYVADFAYADKTKGTIGNLHVEDTKGFRTKDYIIKRKLMKWVHGITIEEI